MPDVPDRTPLIALVDLIEHVALERVGREAAEGSAAHAHLAAQHAWAGEWGERPVQEALNGVGLFFAAGEDHLRSMSVLLAHYPPLAYGPVVLARAGLEASAKAWWMLEPDLTAGAFVCRHMSEQLRNVHEQVRFPSSTIDEADLLARRDRILRSAQSMGIPPTSSRRGRPPFVGKEWPKIGELARSVLGETLGNALYKYFSGVAHAASYTLPWAADLEGAEQVGTDSYLAELALSPPLVRQLVIGGGLSYVPAARRLYAFNGWPTSGLESRAAAVVSASEAWARQFPPPPGGGPS